MKNLLTSIFFVLTVCVGFAQSSDATLTTQANVIKNETVAGANTKTRIGQMFLDIIASKVNNSNLTWANILSKPTTLSGFGITDAVPATRTINGQPLSTDITLTKSNIGLSNADNTSDVAKPVSTLQAAADAAALASANAYTDTQLAIVATEAINGTITLDATDFGKLHTLTDVGTPADYTVTIPDPATHAGKTIYFKGLTTLTRVVTLSRSSVTIAGEANWKLSKSGLVGLLSDGANYIVVAEVGSWIPFTPTWTGFSVNPTTTAKYFRQGRKCNYTVAATSGTSSTTALTLTAPFAAVGGSQVVARIQNSGTWAFGIVFTDGTTTLTAYPTAGATQTWTGSGVKTLIFEFEFEF